MDFVLHFILLLLICNGLMTTYCFVSLTSGVRSLESYKVSCNTLLLRGLPLHAILKYLILEDPTVLVLSGVKYLWLIFLTTYLKAIVEVVVVTDTCM